MLRAAFICRTRRVKKMRFHTALNDADENAIGSKV